MAAHHTTYLQPSNYFKQRKAGLADLAAEVVCEPRSLLERVEKLIKDSEIIAEAAKRKQDWSAATSALREARTCLELLAKIRGELQTGTHVRVGVGVAVGVEAHAKEPTALSDADLDLAIAIRFAKQLQISIKTKLRGLEC